MARFRVRDLLIDVLDQEPAGGAEKLQEEGPCGLTYCPNQSCAWTFCVGCTGVPSCAFPSRACGGCSLQITECPRVSCAHNTCHPAVSDLGRQARAVRPEDLRTLRGELERALAELDAHETAIAERMAPRTLDEVAALEERLSSALEDLERQRAEIEQQGEEDG